MRRNAEGALPDDPIFDRGDHIGGGCSREVYVSKHWPDRVVKVGISSDNLREWNIWRNANRYVRKYLARCYAISADGSRLLMHRTTPTKNKELYNHLVPLGLNCDLHAGNMGKIGNRIVIHDYAGCGYGELPTKTGRQRSRPEFVSL